MHRRVGWSTLFLFGVLFTTSAARAADETPPAAAPAETPPPPPPADMPPPPPPPAAAPMAPPPAVEVPPAAPKPAATPPFKMEAPNGSSIRIGLLLQPQFQSLGSLTQNSMANNLYIRRTRILLGGTLFGTFEYFIDTDFPNLFLGNATTTAGAAGAPDTFSTVKATPGMNIQDAFATWKAYKDYFKIDVGYMLPPLAHNAVQGATTLYSWDYFTYSFLTGNSFGATPAVSPVGRDAGLEARGLVAGGHVEYRLGFFQGLRNAPTGAPGAAGTDVGARNMYRATGRLQINLLDPETGFFYAGTYLGAKKILSFGGAFDVQQGYRYYAGDAFADLPVGPAGVFTAQVNVVHWTGGGPTGTIPTVPSETAVMSEIGFLIAAAQLSPIIRVEHMFVPNAPITMPAPGAGIPANGQTKLGFGAAFWPFGHNSNLKFFYSRLTQTNAVHAQNQFNLQWQIYYY